MKMIFKLLILILTVINFGFCVNSFKSPCGEFYNGDSYNNNNGKLLNYCSDNQICVEKESISNCVLVDESNEISIVQTFDKSWIENGNEFTLFRVHIANYGNHDITKLIIASDFQLYLRDSSSIWGMEFAVNGNENYLTIPSFIGNLGAKEYYSFGYIVRGATSPEIIIASVSFA